MVYFAGAMGISILHSRNLFGILLRDPTLRTELKLPRLLLSVGGIL
jgi:hypothetical protein